MTQIYVKREETAKWSSVDCCLPILQNKKVNAGQTVAKEEKGSYVPASRKQGDRSKKTPRFHKVHVRTSFILSAQDFKLSYGTFQRRNLLFCLFSLPTLSSLGSSKPPLKGEQKQGRRHSEQCGEDISHTIASSHFRLKLEKGRKLKSALPGGLWITTGSLNFSFGDCFRIWQTIAISKKWEKRNHTQTLSL